MIRLIFVGDRRNLRWRLLISNNVNLAVPPRLPVFLEENRLIDLPYLGRSPSPIDTVAHVE